MNLAQVARILSGFCLFLALAQVPPYLWSLLEESPDPTIDAATGFAAGIIVATAAALVLRCAGKPVDQEFYRREGLTVVGLAWLMAGALCAIPFQWSDALPNAADAMFETISGLTTTGASVLGGYNPPIEDLPGSLLFWRSLLQWMGGLGIILVFIVLLPAMGVTGKNLLASEAVGLAKDSLRPRMREQARSLFWVYGILTGSAILLLWLVSPMGFFDALCHGLTTLATGGFSTRSASIGSFDSLTVEWIVILFMFLGGCNFLLLYGAMTRRIDGLRGLVRSTEFRLYTGLTLGLSLFVAFTLWMAADPIPDPVLGARDYTRLGPCLQDAVFNVVSLSTSTGYVTCDWQLWPTPCLMVLIFCILVGGCAGSTAGGLKTVRFLVCAKLISFTVRQFIRPKTVERIKVDGEPLEVRVISGIMALLALWIGTVLVGTLVLSLDPRLDLFSAFSASASMTGCTGPALTSQQTVAAGLDFGSYGGYAALHDPTKLFMSMQMILGRLEILAPLALLAPSFWRR